MYAQASGGGQAEAGQAAGAAGSGESAQSGPGASQEEDVVDADFEEVKDDK
jgi:hypothetical protein